jgi:GT2 family glycosyltransferase
VAIPALGREESTLRLLKSLAGQTEKPDQIVLVECVDIKALFSKKILENILGDSIRIKYIGTKIKNIAYSRNLAMRACDNNWMVFLDNDVAIDLNYIELVSKAVSERGNELVGVVGEVKPLKNGYLSDYSARLFSQGLTGSKKVKKVKFYATLAVVLNLQKIKKWKIRFDNSLKTGEDTDFFLKIYYKGGEVEYNPELMAYHDFETQNWINFVKRYYSYGRNFVNLEKRHPAEFEALGLFPGRNIFKWIFFPVLVLFYLKKLIDNLLKDKVVARGYELAAWVCYLSMLAGVYSSKEGMKKLFLGHISK